MKYLLAALTFVSVTAFSQSRSAEAFTEKYKDDRDATVVSISGSLFNLFANVADAAEDDDEEAQAMARIAREIKSMKILSVPVFRSGLQPDEISSLRNDLMKEKYDELMHVRDGGDRIYCLAQGDEKEVRNVYILIREEDQFTMLTIDGTLKMEDISYLARHHGNINFD